MTHFLVMQLFYRLPNYTNCIFIQQVNPESPAELQKQQKQYELSNHLTICNPNKQ